MAADIAFDLVGDWTSARLLLRLLLVVDCPWEARQTGFTHRDTGERVSLAMAPPDPDLAARFATGTDPLAPSIDEPLLAEIAAHRSVVSVFAPTDSSAPLARCLTVARAAQAIVNGGALAVRCRTSGLCHGADAFGALVDRAVSASVGADPDLDLPAALLPIAVRLDLDAERPRTRGMHALGAPDVILAEPSGPDRAVDRLESVALALLRGEVHLPAAPDDGAGPSRNPLGRTVVPIRGPIA